MKKEINSNNEKLVNKVFAILTKFKDGPTFHRHSRIIRGHAEIDFTKTIEIEEKLHKKATARKVFKRKLQYTPDKMKINLSLEMITQAHIKKKYRFGSQLGYLFLMIAHMSKLEAVWQTL